MGVQRWRSTRMPTAWPISRWLSTARRRCCSRSAKPVSATHPVAGQRQRLHEQVAGDPLVGGHLPRGRERHPDPAPGRGAARHEQDAVEVARGRPRGAVAAAGSSPVTPSSRSATCGSRSSARQRARRGEDLLGATHDHAHRGVAGEQHRQPGDRRRDDVGELLRPTPARPTSAAAVARRRRASSSAVTSRTVASRRSGRPRPPCTTLTRTEPTSRRPAGRWQLHLERGRHLARLGRAAHGIRETRRRRRAGHDGHVPRVGRAERAVLRRSSRAGSRSGRSPRARVRRGRGPPSRRAGRRGPHGARRRPAARARGPLEVARDPRPQLDHRERLDEVVVGAGTQGACSSLAHRLGPRAARRARRRSAGSVRMASTRP